MAVTQRAAQRVATAPPVRAGHELVLIDAHVWRRAAVQLEAVASARRPECAVGRRAAHVRRAALAALRGMAEYLHDSRLAAEQCGRTGCRQHARVTRCDPD